MIDRVTGSVALPGSIRRNIIERTDGIPLFVEEMTKAVLEARRKTVPRSEASLLFRHGRWLSPQACTPP